MSPRPASKPQIPSLLGQWSRPLALGGFAFFGFGVEDFEGLGIFGLLGFVLLYTRCRAGAILTHEQHDNFSQYMKQKASGSDCQEKGPPIVHVGQPETVRDLCGIPYRFNVQVDYVRLPLAQSLFAHI